MSVRYPQRHMEQSAKKWISEYLTSLGWTSDPSGAHPFGAGSTTISTTLIGVEGEDPHAIAIRGTSNPQIGIVIMGNEADTDAELGGVLAETSYDLFVSIVARPSFAVLLKDDIRDLLSGRTRRAILPFYDFSIPNSPALITSEILEVEQVSSGRARPERADWLLVTATVIRQFSRSWS